MESFFSSLDYRDPVWIITAFAFGYLGRLAGLPPLVGFLVAGFILNYLGAEGGDFLYEMADLGITLLLFTIGLKLKVRELAQKEVWASGLIHMAIFSAITVAFLYLLGRFNIPLFTELSWANRLIVAFALSFSSTVFVVKSLEAEGQFLSRFGQLAVGVLILQDLVAVVYLGISEAKIPSIWATLLLAIIYFGRGYLGKILERAGHGELQILFGLGMAMGGAALFEAVDLKADLGALVFGILLAGHPKAGELSRTLFSLKELFLLGFFLSIGIAGLPTAATLLAVGLICLLLPIKSGLFFLLLSRFGVRSYPASKSSLALTNFSEFGLIVASVAVAMGWLPAAWLVTIALTVAVSFAASSVINGYSERIFDHYRSTLLRFQSPTPARAEIHVDLAGIDTLICGMGRVGRGAYKHLETQHRILAVDIDDSLSTRKYKSGLNIVRANMAGTDFWSSLDIANSEVSWVLLTAPNLQTNINAARLARRWGYTGFISAAAKYPDEADKLLESGVDAIFNIYEEAGAGLAMSGQAWLSRENDGTP